MGKTKKETELTYKQQSKNQPKKQKATILVLKKKTFNRHNTLVRSETRKKM